jgi:WD40 repeat protein
MSQTVAVNSMPAKQNAAPVATDGVKRRRIDVSRGVKSFDPEKLDENPTHTDDKKKPKHSTVVRTLACTSDHICSGSAEKEVNLWKCTESAFTLERTLDGHHFGVCSLDMADNARETSLLVAAMMSGEMKIWDIRQHKCIHTIDANPGDISQVRLQRTGGGGGCIISGGAIGDLVKWDMRTWEESGRIRLGCGNVQSIAVSDVGYAACGTEKGIAAVVNLNLDSILGSPAVNHRLPLRALAFSRDARRLACASNDGHISVVNPKALTTSKSSACYEQLISAHTSWVTGVAFHPSGADHLITVSRDKAIRAWKLGAATTKEHLHNGDLKRQWTRSDAIWSVAYATNGAFFATGDAAHIVSVYRQHEPAASNGADPP